jgi:hypothetical protein
MMGHRSAKLSSISFAFASGILNAICMFLLAWMASRNGTGKAVVDMWASFYPGYADTMHGALMGAGWGFVSGFITGLIFALIYNLCACCCSRKCCCGKGGCNCGRASCSSCGDAKTCNCGRASCPVCGNKARS